MLASPSLSAQLAAMPMLEFGTRYRHRLIQLCTILFSWLSSLGISNFMNEHSLRVPSLLLYY